MSALVPKVTRELIKTRRTLRDVFGLEQLRPGQAQVIRSVSLNSPGHQEWRTRRSRIEL